MWTTVWGAALAVPGTWGAALAVPGTWDAALAVPGTWGAALAVPGTWGAALAVPGDTMTIDAWLQAAIADAERRGLPELQPVLEALARATTALRAADFNDHADQ